MSVPSVVITELDGQLGVLPDGARAFAVIGPASSGTLDSPAAYARTNDVVAAFGAGPMVDLACDMIAKTGKPVICVRSGNTVVGTHANVVVTGVTGTSVVTAGADTTPDNDYEPYLKVITGGTIGTIGITFQWSLDGGRTLSATTALGIANTFTFPNSGGIGYAFAAGTLIAGDVVTSRATSPTSNASELTSAITALSNTALAWECACIAVPLDATTFDAVDLAFAGAKLVEKFFLGQFRVPNVAESDATYQAAFVTALGAKSTTRGGVCAGAGEYSSVLSGRKYLRSALHPVASLLYSQTEEVDIADPNLGNLTGMSLRDAAGNLKHHDEMVSPGLDDARAVALRTISPEFPGVYVNNPRLFSAAGSDFEFIQHRRVMILARIALRVYFTRRLSKPVLINPTTGFLLESERLEIQEGAISAMAGLLLAKPKASSVDFELSKYDNLLSTKTLTGVGKVVPLAYPKQINLGLAFSNPALQVVTPS